jgi:hypothetical protein
MNNIKHHIISKYLNNRTIFKLRKNNFELLSNTNMFNNFVKDLDKVFIKYLMYLTRFVTNSKITEEFEEKVIIRLNLEKTDIHKVDHRFINEIQVLMDMYLNFLTKNDLIKILVLYNAYECINISFNTFKALKKKFNTEIVIEGEGYMSAYYLLYNFINHGMIIFPFLHKKLNYNNKITQQYLKYYFFSNKKERRNKYDHFLSYEFYRHCKNEDIISVLKVVFPDGKFDIKCGYYKDKYLLYSKKWDNNSISHLINYIDKFDKITVPNIENLKFNKLIEMLPLNFFYNDKRITNKIRERKIEPIYRIFNSEFREKFKRELLISKKKKKNLY